MSDNWPDVADQSMYSIIVVGIFGILESIIKQKMSSKLPFVNIPNVPLKKGTDLAVIFVTPI
jgi:hypothetical protein